MSFSQTALKLLWENLLFLGFASSFLAIAGWAWRDAKPYSLPEPLPTWFKVWFGTVQIGGGIVPLLVLLLWGGWWGYTSVSVVLVPYLVMLGLQILSEYLTLRQFQSVVWVMVPYLYVPYRVWQLYEGLMLVSPESEPMGFETLLLVEIVLWIGNYLLDLAQLPRLLRWETKTET
jgi:hypothetical protein